MIMFVMGRFIGLRKGMRRLCKSFSLLSLTFRFWGRGKYFLGFVLGLFGGGGSFDVKNIG